jgi:hypothetical protein
MRWFKSGKPSLEKNIGSVPSQEKCLSRFFWLMIVAPLALVSLVDALCSPQLYGYLAPSKLPGGDILFPSYPREKAGGARNLHSLASRTFRPFAACA